MDIEILYMQDCPHAEPAADRVREAVRRAALVADVRTTAIDSPGEARERGMRGSPTILVNGRDAFASDAVTEGSISCRLFLTDGGREGVPSIDQLVEALTR